MGQQLQGHLSLEQKTLLCCQQGNSVGGKSKFKNVLLLEGHANGILE